LNDRLCPRQVDGPLRIRQTQRLLLRQDEASGGTVVFQVASGGLVGEPLANITLVSAGPLRQLPDGFAQKCVESLFVDGHVAPSRKRLQMWLSKELTCNPRWARGSSAVRQSSSEPSRSTDARGSLRRRCIARCAPGRPG